VRITNNNKLYKFKEDGRNNKNIDINIIKICNNNTDNLDTLYFAI